MKLEIREPSKELYTYTLCKEEVREAIIAYIEKNCKIPAGDVFLWGLENISCREPRLTLAVYPK